MPFCFRFPSDFGNVGDFPRNALQQGLEASPWSFREDYSYHVATTFMIMMAVLIAYCYGCCPSFSVLLNPQACREVRSADQIYLHTHTHTAAICMSPEARILKLDRDSVSGKVPLHAIAASPLPKAAGQWG